MQPLNLSAESLSQYSLPDRVQWFHLSRCDLQSAAWTYTMTVVTTKLTLVTTSPNVARNSELVHDIQLRKKTSNRISPQQAIASQRRFSNLYSLTWIVSPAKLSLVKTLETTPYPPRHHLIPLRLHKHLQYFHLLNNKPSSNLPRSDCTIRRHSQECHYNNFNLFQILVFLDSCHKSFRCSWKESTNMDFVE